MSVMRPDLIMKSVIPVVMAGIIAIYGLVVSVLIANKCKSKCAHHNVFSSYYVQTVCMYMYILAYVFTHYFIYLSFHY